MKLSRIPVTLHAIKRYCERVRPDLNPYDEDDRVTATLAMWEMIEAGTLCDGRPEWYTAASVAGCYIDCGDVALLLKWTGERKRVGSLTVTTVVVKDWREPAGRSRMAREVARGHS